jgi:hypothetical protein
VTPSAEGRGDAALSDGGMKHSAEHVIEVRDPRVTFTGGPKPVQAVRGVNLAVDRGDDLRHA